MNLAQLALVGIVLGLVCAAVVWFLERYQAGLLVRQFEAYLASREKPST